MITDEDKERVRQATDFVQLVAETVELRQRGQEFWGCCPFHGEKSPSFKVNPATGLWHCFGCGDGGDVFSYVQRRENLDFPDAIRYLADRAGIELQEERGGRRGPRKTRLMEALGAAEEYYHTMLMRGRGAGPDEARRYFAGRGFGSAVCRRWGLGFAPGRGQLVAQLRAKGFTSAELIAADLAQERSGRVMDRFYDRVMFPIHDEQGRTIAFGGRVIGPKRDNVAKYVNTRDTAAFNKGKHLFAYDRAKETMAATGEAIVCEGYTDVIAMHEAGFTNAVAALGTAFRLDHVRLMERQRVSRIVCMFDGDAAGQRAAERAVRYIDKTSAALLCVVLPDNQDPMEFLSAHGADALRPILAAARPLMDFVFEKRLAGLDLSAPGLRVRALADMAQLLAPLKHSVLLDEYATRLADTLGMDVAETKRAIREAKVAEAEEDRAPARAAARRQSRAQAGAAVASRKAPPEPAPADEAGYVPADYVPADAYEDAPAPTPARPSGAAGYRALSADDRMQVAAERELLGAMAQRPEALRPYAERIAALSWSDARHEAMAWAMLSTPEGTSPAAAVAAASSVVPEAPSILSGGRVMGDDELSDAEKLDFIVDTAELCSCRRRIRQIRAALSSSSRPDEESQALFREATELQRRVNELVRTLSSVSSE
ncbi:DNA primase [Thermophilibacter provencensis]|uniref:DNA primase n=1 Tax=Thermophilibacter provencensis TaxID=1852386 RepID=A0A921GF22_9ACTN|nr:DNA primase [Thermophilibacter provencensis]HJF45602.1 DNA primase [Thermophilibacter provencensis]